MTVAPASRAIRTAALPTPLAAAGMNTTSPGRISASRCRQYQADSHDVGNAAAASQVDAVGDRDHLPSATTARSA